MEDLSPIRSGEKLHIPSSFEERIMEMMGSMRNAQDSMSNEMGTSVWNFKGGWYTKPDTNIHLPYCRHTWHQYLIKAK